MQAFSSSSSAVSGHPSSAFPAALFAKGAAYSSDPLRDAQRHHSALAAEQARQHAQEAALTADFLHAARSAPLQAPATFAPRISDYSRGAAHPFQRHPSIAEVMFDALDYPGGPSHDDLLGFLAHSAQAGHTEASTLLARMAATWASHHVD
jgi:hypothetical protein